ncbi:glycosyl transferase family 39 [Cellulophaga algicola DSM 14237]|uniref:Glycosyl transferase family 39 n=1 Tax=Cellulophaga algicola (strain DSM 14237 / IC166 / ACAM 630) TaxID=688270 RepID=E6XAJ3_CELAD|nr:glycosyltransferase family 39 protein [Cellulophaga algicola]ADV49909.1 glycosyl transferase family 39 [Cellulophaga algicola DSM 14237]
MLLKRIQKISFEKLTLFTILIYIVSLFYNLHLEPLRLEEPRRALVALEMLFNNNFIVTTLLNDTWYDHPPLYNIILALSLKIFGLNTFALRFPCAFSLLLTGVLIYVMGKKYISKKFGILSTLFYLIAADIYFYFSTIAEIDIFYSLLVLLSFFSIFHFHQKKQYYHLFGFAYLFISLAFLTKGFASYAFIVLTLSAYLGYQREFKKLFSFPHILFGFCALVFLGLYLYTYSLYEDLPAYISKMWGLTSSRTVLGRGIGKLALHILTFPLNFIAVLFPSTLFLLFSFKKGQIKRIKEKPYLVFLALTLFINFSVYLISPGAKIRYTYMFFPIAISLLTYSFYLQIEDKEWRKKVFYSIIKTLMLLIAAALFIAPFISISANPVYLNLSLPLFGIAILSTLYLNIKSTTYIKSLSVILFFIVCRLTFDHIAMPIKANLPKNNLHKNFAENINKLVSDDDKIYVLTNDEMNTFIDIPFLFYETAAYLEMSRKQLVYKAHSITKKGYYIINLEKNKGYTPVYLFEINNTKLALIKQQ